MFAPQQRTCPIAVSTQVCWSPAATVDGLALVRALADRYANLAASTRAAIDTATLIGDMGTADLFTELSRDLDKSLWFLEAHVQGK